MQNLKVYLTTRHPKHKPTLQKLKPPNSKPKHYPHEQQQNPKINEHQTSHNNLTKSYQSKHNASTNGKKRTMSNNQSHNRSLQQIYDFRAEVKKIIKEPLNRYERDGGGGAERHFSKVYMGSQSIEEKKRNSKQVTSSDTRLYYRSQPSNSLDKIGNRNIKSEKNLQAVTYKGLIKGNFQPITEEKPVLKIKSTVKQTSSIPQPQNTNKYPTKKRSKSANVQNKKTQQSKKTKQKRTNSVRKLPKPSPKNQQSSLKDTVNLFNQLSLKSMFRTRKGVQIMNPNKVNQDRLFLKQNFLMSNNENMWIYAVADGHGPQGHHVSHLIVENLYKKFDSYLKHKNSVEMSLERSFHDLQAMLLKNIDFNADFSGSTLVTIVIEDNKRVTCANVGDSRAIVARQLSKTSWEVIRLSNDHKPNLEHERKRIIKCGGRIDTVYDEQGKGIGPLRVWLPKKQLQGLAMSRSLGDNISKPIGVTHQPQILSHQLTCDDKFILLASDGVWQFLSNYQILSLIIPYYKQNRLEDACEALMKEAYRSWTKQDNSIVDDITFILIFLCADGRSMMAGAERKEKKEEEDSQESKEHDQEPKEES